MRVFISWSGERSNKLAVALHDWLPLVLHYIEPWLSEADIEAGDRWAQSVAKELAAANFGIVCVTPENANAPWVLFEAGALAKSLEASKVIPLLLELEFSDISGPLAQFQAKKAVQSGLREIVNSIQSSAEVPIPGQRAGQLFDALWPQLEEKISDIPRDAPAQRHVRPQHEVLEELVTSVRAIEVRSQRSDEAVADLLATRKEPIEGYIAERISRLDESLAGIFHSLDRRSAFYLNPPMAHRIANQFSRRDVNPVKLMVWASVLQDQMPWLYDISVNINAIWMEGRDPDRALHVLRLVLEGTAKITSGPQKFGVDSDSFDAVVRAMTGIVNEMLGKPSGFADLTIGRIPDSGGKA